MLRCAAALLLCGFVAPPAVAQVVQLPSIDTFSIRTTVLVPDSGGAYLGGVGRSAFGRTSQGVPGWGPLGRNTSRAGAVMGSGVMVHATIIDHAELDELVLEEARALREAKGIKLADDSRPRITPASDSPAESVAAIKRRLMAEDALRESEAEADLKRAVAYEKDGDFSLARNYYRVAARKSSGAVREMARERLAGLSKRSSVAKR